MELNTIIEIFSTIILFVGLLLTFLEIKKNNQLRRQDFYTQLELASIDLFKLEIDNPSLIIVYSKNTPPKLNEEESFKIEEYISALLNLFEIQFRFRKKKNMYPEIFASWVPWIFDALNGKIFRQVWSEIKFNYDPSFRKFLDDLIRILEDKSLLEEEVEQEFYSFASKYFKCKNIANWKKMV